MAVLCILSGPQRAAALTLVLLSLCALQSDGAINEYDQPLSYECPSNSDFVYMDSEHNNHKGEKRSSEEGRGAGVSSSRHSNTLSGR